MRRPSVWLLLLLPLTLSCAPPMLMGSHTYLGFSIDLAGAPPPPRVEFAGDPDEDEVPGTQVYVVRNSPYDLFQCEEGWYLSYQGYWYRADERVGPYELVDVHRVPREVLTLPHERWKHDPRRAWRERERGRDDQGDRDD